MSIALTALAMAAAQSPDVVVGKWMTPTQRHGVVEISRCGPSICGKLLTSDGIAANPMLKDINNKDEHLRGRLLKGLAMLGGFKFEDGAWNDGTIYNAEDGKTYEARITIIDADTLKLRGCIFVPLCKNQTWARVRRDAPSNNEERSR